MSEIEVGEWVRLKDGRIRVFKQYINDTDVELTRPYNLEKKADIAKHSKNIIDLIEEGDYVNYERILDITGDYIRTTESIHNRFWLSNNIKSIVTKEQISQIEYKVGE